MTQPSIEIDSFWLPRQSSTAAEGLDWAFYYVYGWSVVLFVGVIAAMLYFAYRYRRRTDKDITSEIAHSTKLEITWTVLPLILVLSMFFVGAKGYLDVSVAPGNAYEVNVTAQKWSWAFSYPNGKTSINELVVPKGKPIRLVMSSRDVVHSLWIPEFRIKQDVVPANYTSTWFEAPETIETALLCTEYCGTDHSNMLATVRVVDEAEFEKFLEEGEDDSVPPAEAGKKVFATMGCAACHSMEGVKGVGPALNGIFGKTHEMTDGAQVQVDEAYLRESIVQANAKIVKGFAPVMPVFQGVLNDRQVDALIAYIKSQQ